MAPPSYRETVRRLSGVQKSSRGAPGWSRWVNRRLGRWIAAAAYLARMTPNQVTGISAALTAGAIALLVLVHPSWPMAVATVLLLIAGYAFDSADGQLARLRGGGSVAGEWLDHVVDCVKTLAVHLAVVISWSRFDNASRPALLIPLGYTLVASTFFFAVILSEQLRKLHRSAAAPVPAAATADTGSRAPVLRSIIVLPADYGVLCLAFLLLPAHRVFLIVYSVLLAANTVFLVGALRNWFRELTALARY